MLKILGFRFELVIHQDNTNILFTLEKVIVKNYMFTVELEYICNMNRISKISSSVLNKGHIIYSFDG